MLRDRYIVSKLLPHSKLPTCKNDVRGNNYGMRIILLEKQYS